MSSLKLMFLITVPFNCEMMQFGLIGVKIIIFTIFLPVLSGLVYKSKYWLYSCFLHIIEKIGLIMQL